MSVKVKLIAPDGGDRIVPVLGDTVVEHGGEIEVPEDVAGEPPRWRQLGKPGEDELHPTNDPSGFFDRRQHAGKDEVYDLGYGLLAQTDVWALASAAKAPAKTKES